MAHLLAFLLVCGPLGSGAVTHDWACVQQADTGRCLALSPTAYPAFVLEPHSRVTYRAAGLRVRVRCP